MSTQNCKTKMDKDQIKKNVSLITKQLDITSKELKKILSRMVASMNNSLQGKPSSLKMLNSFVTNLPNRKQTGVFYGIDLGGSNLRVLQIRFDNGKMQKNIEYEAIPDQILNGTQKELFDLIALVVERCARKTVDEENIHLNVIGFTFSFPVRQISLQSGELIRWTKGFNVQGVVDCDVSALLIEAIKRRPKLSVDKVVLLNDTVGTLLCGAQMQDNVSIGFIMGTGCNACYIENSENLPHLSISAENVIINTEFGAFGERGELSDILTGVDIQVDKTSLRPGQQPGEDADTVFEKFGMQSELNRWALTELCVHVCERAAKVAAAGLAALIQKMGVLNVVIAADGSVVKKNKLIQTTIVNTIKGLIPDVDVNLELVSDGSGTGAAILASTLLN